MSVGAFSQAMFGFETLGEGIQAGTMYGLRVKNFQCNPDPMWDRPETIDPRGQQQKSRGVGFGVNVSFELQPSVNDIARLRAHHQGFAAITSPAAGVHDWAIRDFVSGDAANNMDSISFEFDRDDGATMLIIGMKIITMEWKIEKNKLVGVKVSGVAIAFTFMKDAVYVGGIGNTFTGKCRVRGNRLGFTDADDVANDLRIRFHILGAPGVAAYRTAKGGSGAIGSGTAFVTPATVGWADLIYSGDGLHASGDPYDPVQILFTQPGGVGSNFVVDDEFTIDAKRTKAVATFPAMNALTAVGAKMTMGGTTYRPESYSIKFTRPRDPYFSCGSKYAETIFKDNGDRKWEISIVRNYQDRDFFKRILNSGDPAAFVLNMNGDLITTVGGVSYYEQHKMNAPNTQVIGAGSNVDSKGRLQETIKLEPTWNGTSVDLDETLRTTLATLV